MLRPSPTENHLSMIRVATALFMVVAVCIPVVSLSDWSDMMSSPSGDAVVEIKKPLNGAHRSSAQNVSGEESEHFDRIEFNWFGQYDEGQLKPPEVIETSQRDLDLIGIGTSSSEEESFALIRTGRGGVKSFNPGDEVESGIALYQLIPNAVILKVDSGWEKLTLGTPSDALTGGSTTSSSKGHHHHARSGAIAGLARPASAGPNSSATISSGNTNKAVQGGRERPSPSIHPENPNLSNREIRERLQALAVELNQ